MGTLIIDKSADFSGKSVAKYYPQMDAVVKNQDGFTKYCSSTDDSVTCYIDNIGKSISSNCHIKYTGLIGNKISDAAVVPIIFSITDYLGNTPISLYLFKNKDTNNLCIRTVVGKAWKIFDTGCNLGSDGLVLTNDETISGGRFVFADIETSFDGDLAIKTIKVNEQLYALTLRGSGKYSDTEALLRRFSINNIVGQAFHYYCHTALIGFSVKCDNIQTVLIDVEGETNVLKVKDKISNESLIWTNSNPKILKTTFSY